MQNHTLLFLRYMMMQRKEKLLYLRDEVFTGLMVGLIWGIAEYGTNVLFFKLHWNFNLKINSLCLLIVMISYLIVGVILALFNCGFGLLFQPLKSRHAVGSDFNLRFFKYAYFIACFSFFAFLKDKHWSSLPWSGFRVSTYLVLFIVIYWVIYLGLKRIIEARKNLRGTVLIFSIAGLVGMVGFYQWIVIYHLIDLREDLQSLGISPVRDDLPDVLLVTIDTLRPDHLGCYGSSSVKSENINALAREGILFENAVTQIPYTLPSHSSLMTSLYPESHGVLSNVNYQLQGEV